MPKTAPKKRKRPVPKGILGYPKKTKLLFFINQDDSNDENSDTSDSDFGNNESTKHKTQSKIFANTTNKDIDQLKTQDDWSKNLPYEILLKIFIYFSFSAVGDLNKIKILKNVCRYWGEVAEDPKLWHHVNILTSLLLPVGNQHTPNNIKEAAKFETKLNKFVRIAVMHKKFDYLSNLDLSSCGYLTCDHLEAILAACNSDVLSTLNLSHCKKIYSTKYETEASYEKVIGDSCPKLISLNLTGMHKQLNASNLNYMFVRIGSNLRSLFISENILSVSVFQEITQNCPNLSDLHVSNSEIKGILNFNNKTFPSNLKSLHMLQTHPKTKFTSIFSVLTADTPCLQKLETFSFAYSTGQFNTDQTAYTIAKVCKDAISLKSLDIRNYRSSFSLSSVNLFDMIASETIECLYLSGSKFDLWEVEYLAKAISDRWRKSLIELDLSWTSLSVEYLQLIFNAFNRNDELTILRGINLSGTCVSTDMIREFVNKFPKIEAIDLSSCRSVDRGLKKLIYRKDLINLL